MDASFLGERLCAQSYAVRSWISITVVVIGEVILSVIANVLFFLAGQVRVQKNMFAPFQVW